VKRRGGSTAPRTGGYRVERRIGADNAERRRKAWPRRGGFSITESYEAASAPTRPPTPSPPPTPSQPPPPPPPPPTALPTSSTPIVVTHCFAVTFFRAMPARTGLRPATPVGSFVNCHGPPPPYDRRRGFPGSGRIARLGQKIAARLRASASHPPLFSLLLFFVTP
jgi:hypothetical protein